MTTIQRQLTGAVVALVVSGIILIGGFAFANPSFFGVGVTTNNAASTTPAYMTPGNSTSTTPVYDAYAQTFNGGQTYKTDSAGLLIQLTGSSTATVLNVNVEYSQDGVDWYRNVVIDPIQIGTTTSPFLLANAFSMSWKFASSTVGGVATATDRATTAIVIPTPFRYTRVVLSMTGANGAVWAQLVPIKERP